MSANPIGSTSPSDGELDAARNFLDGLVADRRNPARIAIVENREHSSNASADPIQKGSEPDQFARDIEEIERAADALRKGEPDLEPWTMGSTAVLDQPKPPSVWLFVGAIWITTVLVTGAATLAITSLV
jgi:hypothetical protein